MTDVERRAIRQSMEFASKMCLDGQYDPSLLLDENYQLGWNQCAAHFKRMVETVLSPDITDDELKHMAGDKFNQNAPAFAERRQRVK